MKTNEHLKMGLAGRLSQLFLYSKLTPVIALFSIFIGLVAVVLTPKEEEPQISVPMMDIMMSVPGLEAAEVERKVTEVIERSVWGIDGVEYVYSTSQAHQALVTVRFKVGEPLEPSLVKIHQKMMTVQHDLPSFVSPYQLKSYTIDDVPFLVLTFSSRTLNSYELRTQIAPLAREFSSTPDLSKVELKGGQKRAIRIVVDPARLKSKGVSLLSVAESLKSNQSFITGGKDWGEQHTYQVDLGGRLSSVQSLETLSVGQFGGRVITLKEVAEIIDGPEVMTRASVLMSHENPSQVESAVSIVFSKRKGTNVVDLSERLLKRVKTFSKELPKDIQMSVVRNYGATAQEKSKELIEHLLIATLSVSVLIALAMGLRASLVVLIAIPVTLALTLAIYYFLGYTLNRITLFALIFSIGILVDDAIVVVENIERHLKENPKLGKIQATLNAVNEVGNPTILATFTVIAAILPMAFVSGLMGPYMKPIPVGASLAMVLSLLVAFVITPWASVRILKAHTHTESEAQHSRIDQMYTRWMNRLLGTKKQALLFVGLIGILFFAAVSLLGLKAVKVKMLPFDNKNEFQVLLDFPPTTPLKEALTKSTELSQVLLKNPEIKKIQVFSGESAPFSFSGMVKHSFLRNQDYQADLQVVLSEKHDRSVSSHQIIESVRPMIQEFSRKYKVVSKVLEIPPGPPVMATMVAEIYGPSRISREQAAAHVYQVFESEKSVVDLDTSLRELRPRKVYQYDYFKGALVGGQTQMLTQMGSFIFSEVPLGFLNESTKESVLSPESVELVLSTRQSDRSSERPLDLFHLPSSQSGILSLKELSQPVVYQKNTALYRKNLKPVSYVMSELSGAEEAPVYGISKLQSQIHYPTQTAEVPWDTSQPVVKWDGEWFITYEVFRDLGAAFGVVVILIYILVLGWFKSYTVPLVIMAPIPISLIGILPGHALLGAYFTATSMIGFIAGAGIIVRNSIILVDFIEHQMSEGLALKEAVMSAGLLRFRPMLLTAAAVVVGSAVMLADPIFQGLAVSLMFGEIAATILSRFAVPVFYYWTVGHSREQTIRRIV